jgi:hypothetical protein
MSLRCLQRSSHLVSCRPARALHCSSEHVLWFSGLEPTLPRLRRFPQLHIRLIKKWDELLLIARDVFPITKLCLESVWPFLVFDVVTVTESNHLVRPL